MAVKYIGGGILPGVPARDLTDEEIKALDPALQELLSEHLKLEDGRVYNAVKTKSEEK